jgi:UDP-2,4-diacetamido-2,4,6-trideoxy-beta-L-altropyranose hydrolase
MQVIIRTDASHDIGTGHVMRCLALADALAAQGVECAFICRQHTGNLIEHIHSKGYLVHTLPVSDQEADLRSDVAQQLVYARWLGASWEQDVEACDSILAELHPDWLIVDHYSLDARWEGALKQHCSSLMVIDDLADRPHLCELLLDQTFGRLAADYKPLVPAECTLLCGSMYALLRPEFEALRIYSLQRREYPQLHRLLITMGGVDIDNVTAQVLGALKYSELPSHCRITVVMGVKAPWLAEVCDIAEQMPWPTKVRVNVENMAQLMADSDLAIGAAGATSWERCCLGLPTLMCVSAENQKYAAKKLEQAQAVKILNLGKCLKNDLLKSVGNLALNMNYLKELTESAKDICDGKGCHFVVCMLKKLGVE